MNEELITPKNEWEKQLENMMLGWGTINEQDYDAYKQMKVFVNELLAKELNKLSDFHSPITDGLMKIHAYLHEINDKSGS